MRFSTEVSMLSILQNAHNFSLCHEPLWLFCSFLKNYFHYNRVNQADSLNSLNRENLRLCYDTLKLWSLSHNFFDISDRLIYVISHYRVLALTTLTTWPSSYILDLKTFTNLIFADWRGLNYIFQLIHYMDLKLQQVGLPSLRVFLILLILNNLELSLPLLWVEPSQEDRLSFGIELIINKILPFLHRFHIFIYPLHIRLRLSLICLLLSVHHLCFISYLRFKFPASRFI